MRNAYLGPADNRRRFRQGLPGAVLPREVADRQEAFFVLFRSARCFVYFSDAHDDVLKDSLELADRKIGPVGLDEIQIEDTGTVRRDILDSVGVSGSDHYFNPRRGCIALSTVDRAPDPYPKGQRGNRLDYSGDVDRYLLVPLEIQVKELYPLRGRGHRARGVADPWKKIVERFILPAQQTDALIKLAKLGGPGEWIHNNVDCILDVRDVLV